MITFKIIAIAICISIPVSAFAADEVGVWLEAEGGQVWQTINDVQIPSDAGTRFSLVTLGKGPATTGRVYLGYRVAPRHEIRALYAPLTLNLEGAFGEAVGFRGETFSPNVAITAKYQFNSYRLTYRYLLVDDDTWTFGIGFTGKVRDAEVELVQGAKRASSANVGFVPLLHISAIYKVTDAFRLTFDADALASPQGRAEDVALFAGYRVSPGTELRLGYRTVEGGTAGKTGGTYSFAWLHYAVAGLRLDF